MSQKTAHVMSLLVAVLVLAGCMPKQARAHAQATMVEIDGQKTPWLIPDYVSWEWIFRLVSRRDELEGFEFSVGRWPGLTPEDRRRLYATAEAYIKHRTECDTRKEARYHELQDQHVSAEVSDRDLRGITLSCRYVTLEMADKLMEAVSDQSRVVLQNLFTTGKTIATVRLSESELPFFRLPR